MTGRVWRGSAFGGVKGRTQLPGYVERYLRGEIKVDEFVTHTMPLEHINDAFDLMHAGHSIRSVILLLGRPGHGIQLPATVGWLVLAAAARRLACCAPGTPC